MRKLLLVAPVIVTTFISLGAAAQPEPAKGWTYRKDDPKTHLPVVIIEAKSYVATGDGHTFRLGNMTARLYDKRGLPYKQISSKEAVIDERLGTLAYGADKQTRMSLRSPAR